MAKMTNEELLEQEKRENRRLQMTVGKVKKLRDEGLSTTEIAQKLGLGESTIRSVNNIIDKAEAKRKTL